VGRQQNIYRCALDPTLTLTNCYAPPPGNVHRPTDGHRKISEVMDYSHLLLVHEHPVDFLDGLVGGLLRLKLDKPVAFGLARAVGGNLAGQDVAESGESIMEGLVVDALVQVLQHKQEHAASRLAS
jgi:hypothetical protein